MPDRPDRPDRPRDTLPPPGEPADPDWGLAAVLAGTALAGGVLLALTWPQASARRRLPSDDWQTSPTFTEADVEAAARMLASENPRGSQALHIELIHTQLRSRRAGQSLFDRITAGSGWGPQGESKPAGRERPVSTESDASPELRRLAREVLAGLYPSQLPQARTFFEPAQQDRAAAIGAIARQKQAAGLPLTAQERRLIRYRLTAAEVRKRWQEDGAKLVGSRDGVEFYT